MMYDRCPMCQEQLQIRENQQVCLCGWQKPLLRKSEHNNTHDHRCDYQIIHERCPLPGSISLNIRGNGFCYCALHWQALNDAGLGEAALRDAQANYVTFMAARRPWQDVLLEKMLKQKNKEIN